MEVWIKDVWKNSKCDLDNKRYLKKRILYIWLMNLYKGGLKIRIYYVIYWLFLEICVDI